MKKISALFIVVLVICGILCLEEGAFAKTADQPSDKSVSVLRGDQLSKSVVSFDHSEFGPVKTVIKTEHYLSGEHTGPQLAAVHYFKLSFYENDNDVQFNGGVFLNAIGIYDGNKEIQVRDSNSPECSITKIFLMRRGKSEIYLVTVLRDVSVAETQADRAPQIVTVYKLIDNNGIKPDSDKTGHYFDKIISKESNEKACDPDDVYSITLKAFNELAKEGKIK